MVGTNESRDPRPAAYRRDEAAAGRDDAAGARDAMSHTRDLAADERDQAARGRDVDEIRRRNELVDRLLELRIQITTPRHQQTADPTDDPDGAGPTSGLDGDTGTLVLARDGVGALIVLVEDVLELLGSSRQAGRDAADDRRSSARDRHAAEDDRWRSAEDRAGSASDRDQAAVDREQVDFRVDLPAIVRRAEDAHGVVKTTAEIVGETVQSSRERIAESKRILGRLNETDAERSPPQAR